MKPEQIRNQKGQSLIQVLVSVAIMGILTMALVSTQTMQSRENRALAEKLAALDFQQQLTKTFSDGTLCTALLSTSFQTPPVPITFSSADTAKTLPFTTIPISSIAGAPALVSAGAPLSPLVTNLLAAPTQPFTLSNISGSNDGTTGTYTANFQVAINQANLIRAIQPLSTQVTLRTSTSGATQTITGCSGASSIKRIMSYSANAVHVVSGNCTQIRAKVWGAGGAGGTTAWGGTYSASAGGGAGEYREGIFTVTPGQALTVTIGAGGTPPSGNGTASSIGTFISSSGGGGGGSYPGGCGGSKGTPGAGGSGGTGGQIAIPGGAGAAGWTDCPSGTNVIAGGPGAAFGSSGMGSTYATLASFPGGGGRGANGGGAGQAGQGGFAIVEEL